MDLSKLSDEELDKLDQAQSMDLSQLSDAELDALERGPSKLESLARGAAQGLTANFADEITGALESAPKAPSYLPDHLRMPGDDMDPEVDYKTARDQSRQAYQRAQEEHPFTFGAGQIGGGVASAVLPGGLVSKGVGGAIALGAGLGAASGAGNSVELKDVPMDMLSGAAVGGAAGGIAYGAGKLIEKGANKLTNSDAAKALGQMLKVNRKANAAEIEAAAQRMGTKATPGMLLDDELIQNAENSISQNPSIPGWLLRREQKGIEKAAKSAADDLLKEKTALTPFEVGEKVKDIVKSTTAKKFEPSEALFDDLAQYTRDIPATKGSLDAVGRNISKMREVDAFPSSKTAQMARGVLKTLEKNPSAEEIKQLRGMVGSELETATGIDRQGLLALYHKLGRLEENTIKRGVISSARSRAEGDTIAKGMLGQLKDAKRSYFDQMSKIEDFGSQVGLGNFSSKQGFLNKVDAIPSENLPQKMFNLGRQQTIQATEGAFPEAASLMRQSRLAEIAKSASDKNLEVVPNKLLSATKDMAPEAQRALFKDNLSKLQDLRTVQGSIPGKVGASDTSRGLAWQDMVNPVMHGKDLVRFAAYKGKSSDSVQRVANFLLSQPKFKNMAETNPDAFRAAVYQFTQRVEGATGGMLKAAGFNPSEQMTDDEAKQSFLEGN